VSQEKKDGQDGWNPQIPSPSPYSTVQPTTTLLPYKCIPKEPLYNIKKKVKKKLSNSNPNAKPRGTALGTVPNPKSTVPNPRDAVHNLKGIVPNPRSIFLMFVQQITKASQISFSA